MNLYTTTAWTWFSQYIKLRDANPYGKCVSCGKDIIYSNKDKSSNNCDAGHYISIGF